MPTVTLNRKEFEKLVGKKLPDDKLKDRISMIGTDLEKIDENEIHVEIFPNRPDWLSEQGFARAFSAFIGEKTGLRKYEVKKSGYEVIIDRSVSMRPYTACAIIKNIPFTDERIKQVMQTQEKLAKTHGRDRRKSAYGLYPSQTINFPVHYIAKDPEKVMFQPLGFDRKMPASEVQKVHPKGREYKHISKDWTKYAFFIDAKDNVMCMMPFTNSEDTGKIDETTKEVFIECTGTDLNNVMVALNMFVTMLSEMGGEIYSIDMVYPDKKITTPDLTPQKMEIDLAYVNKTLGLDLKEKDMKELLERMNYGYEKGKALVPAYRADVMHQADLIEDIAIAYGYENFEEIIPKVATIAQENPFSIFKRRLAYVLTGLGLLETSSYSLIDSKYQTGDCLLDVDVISILDPVSLEYNSLRFWMIPSLLHILQKNKHHEYPQKLFEIGRVFSKDETKENKTKEQERLCVMSCHDKADFTEAKQHLDYVMNHLDIAYDIEETEHPSFIPGRVARISVKGKKVAYVGEVHPQVLQQFELEHPVCTVELNVSEIFEVLEQID